MVEKKGVLCIITATETASEEEAHMLRMMNTQFELDFQASSLAGLSHFFSGFSARHQSLTIPYLS